MGLVAIAEEMRRRLAGVDKGYTSRQLFGGLVLVLERRSRTWRLAIGRTKAPPRGGRPMTEHAKKALEMAADKEMRANLGRPVTLETDLQSIMGVVGMLQLACRHPGISDNIRRAAHVFVDNIGATLQEAGLHNLAALVQAGWNREFDEERRV